MFSISNFPHFPDLRGAFLEAWRLGEYFFDSFKFADFVNFLFRL